MSDYTPDLRRVKAIYTDDETECLRSVVPLDQAKSHAWSGFDRFIAKIKADALREATRGGNIDCASSLYLNDLADRIEGEA